MDSPKSSDDYVGLNVGGKIYQTSRETLTRYPNKFFDGLLDGSVLSVKDGRGNYIIERDGVIFRHVLNFMRYGKLVLPGDFNDFHPLECEADFLSLNALKLALNDLKRDDGNVGLNVGGKIYRTSWATLDRYPNSYFQGMLFQTATDDQGNYLIDQDGEIFRHVLNFMKSGELVLPEAFDEFDLLENEANFFKLEDLREMVFTRRVRTVGYVLNGQVFKLRREDILREQDSHFAMMLRGEFPVPTDPQGNHIIERAVDVVHYVIQYIKHGGIFKDISHDDLKRLKKEADNLRLYVLNALHLKSIETLQGLQNGEDEPLYLHIIFDHCHTAHCIKNPCIVYINKPPSFFHTKGRGDSGRNLLDFFCGGQLDQIAVGSLSGSVGKVNLRKIKQGDERIGLQDFVAYFSTRMPGSVDTVASSGYFTLLKATILLNSS